MLLDDQILISTFFTHGHRVKRLGRAIWKKWSGYHYRSLVETKMHCIKSLGDSLTSRNFQSQVNEIHSRMQY